LANGDGNILRSPWAYKTFITPAPIPVYPAGGVISPISLVDAEAFLETKKPATKFFLSVRDKVMDLLLGKAKAEKRRSERMLKQLEEKIEASKAKILQNLGLKQEIKR